MVLYQVKKIDEKQKKLIKSIKTEKLDLDWLYKSLEDKGVLERGEIDEFNI